MLKTPRLDDVEHVHTDLARLTRERAATHRGEAPRLAGHASLPAFEFFSQAVQYSHPIDEIVETYLRNFTGRNPKSHATIALNVRIFLNPEQMEQGTELPIQVPTFRICPQCGGSGQAGFYMCEACEGRGFTEQMHSMRVLIPAGSQQGRVIPVPLGGAGVENLYLNIHVSTL